MSKCIVKISEGSLRGQIKTNIQNENFFSFEGIPYGEPPVGELRFKAPVPVKKWDGIKDALSRDAGSLCKDLNIKFDAKGNFVAKWVLTGSENCLNLNVYTRSLPDGGKTKPKPVMFFIHGGAFLFGSTNTYGTEKLMTEDIVLVTIHYRLGALGFLVLEDPELDVPGNASMKDMVLALKWVQRNIHFFNGDPKNVTIFGHSAGGASINHLVLSPSASGLFHKAIIQSGCSINPWAIGTKNNAKPLAKVLGCQSTNEKEILKYLQSLPAEKIYEGQETLGDSPEYSSPRYFGPVVEDKNDAPFLTEEPIKLITSGKFNQVPIMIGYTDMESMPFLLSHLPNDEPSPFSVKCFGDDALVPQVLGFKENSNEFKQTAEKIRDFYYGNKKPELLSVETIQSSSDTIFIRGLIKAAKHMGNSSKEPVYLYRFRTPTYAMKPFLDMKITGVHHSAELSHLFKYTFDIKHIFAKEEVVQKWFVKMWTNFAKYGNPTYEQDEHINLEWKPVAKNSFNFLDIGNELKMDVDPEKESMAFWDGIFGSYKHSEDY